MEQTEQLKTLIHHVLHRYKFYRLEMHHLQEILFLLRQPSTQDPQLIQQGVFRGIVQFEQHHKDRIGTELSHPRYSGISLEVKFLMHKILHQFYFLNSIKAFEMFQQRYRQPGMLSQQNRYGMVFDDQYEKARLHFLYYGPYSIYHINNLKPAQISMSPNSQFIGFVREDTFKNDGQLLGNKNLIKQQKSQEIINHPEIEKVSGVRGRPPNQKKRFIEKLSSKITPQLKKILTKHFTNEKVFDIREEQFKYCACRGFLRLTQIFHCRCGHNFHRICIGDEAQECLGCAMQTNDHFNKVSEVLGQFYLDWDENSRFQQQINVKPFEKVCGNERYDIIVSCMYAGQPNYCWPDDVVLRINGKQIFEIPALLTNHNKKRRQDSCYSIASYLYQREIQDSKVETTKIILQPSQYLDQLTKRRRYGVFRFGIYFVERLSVENVFENIVNQNRLKPTIIPDFSISGQDIELEQIAASILDPYSKKTIETPVRGALCMHLDCFDLLTYLIFNQAMANRDTRCPICRKNVKVLIIDKFQLRILEQIQDLPTPPKKIVYKRDGSLDFEDPQLSSESSDQNFE